MPSSEEVEEEKRPAATSFISVTRLVSHTSLGLTFAYHRVLSLILGFVPERSRAQVLDACKSIGVTVGLDKAKPVLRGVSGVSRHIMNSLEACCVAGVSPYFARRAMTDTTRGISRSPHKARIDLCFC